MLRREPWRVLFPLGTLLAWLGVGPWLLFALRLERAYLPLSNILGYRAFLHPLAELEGFVSCFACGFLFALLPRLTGTAPAAAWEALVAIAAPLVTVALTALGRWELGQAATAVLVVVALHFTLRRVRPSVGALWIVYGLLLGATGAALAAGRGAYWMREMGRDLVMQGMFTAIAIGAARMLRADEPRPTTRTLAVQVAAALAFAASFWVGPHSGQHLGFALRALACIALARPLVPAWDFGPANLRRGFAHLALWLLAFGYAWAALAVSVRRAGLHVIFVGTLGALLMAALAQTGVRPRLVASCAALLALSMMARAMVELDPQSFHLWMGLSAASFLLATLGCAVASLRLPEAAQSV